MLHFQSSLCGQRGLEVESDLQTYEIALSTQFRVQFDKVLCPLRAERAEGALPPGAVNVAQQQKSKRLQHLLNL